MKAKYSQKILNDLSKAGIIVKTQQLENNTLIGLFENNETTPFLTFINKNEFESDLMNAIVFESNKLKSLSSSNDKIGNHSFKKDHKKIKFNTKLNEEIKSSINKEIKRLTLLFMLLQD